MPTTPGYHRTGDCAPAETCLICDESRAWQASRAFTPEPCEECGSTAECDHYDAPETWALEWLTPTEQKAARAAESE